MKLIYPLLFSCTTLLFYNCGQDLVQENSESSEIVDPCEGVICGSENSVCMDGACECVEGFDGVNCDNEITPQKIILENFVHLATPKYNGNLNWDEVGGLEADLYLKMYKLPEPVSLFRSSVLTDHTFNERGEFSMELPFVKPDEDYIIQVFDEDPGNDDFIANLYFTTYTKGNGFPKSLELTDDTGKVRVEFELRYEY